MECQFLFIFYSQIIEADKFFKIVIVDFTSFFPDKIILGLEMFFEYRIDFDKLEICYLSGIVEKEFFFQIEYGHVLK